MPRLRNTQTGSVVVVDDETAATLGAGAWERVTDVGNAPRKTPAKKAASSKPDDSK